MLLHMCFAFNHRNRIYSIDCDSSDKEGLEKLVQNVFKDWETCPRLQRQ